jgi:hypothetical protein
LRFDVLKALDAILTNQASLIYHWSVDMHVALLGDSILDNGVYTGGEPDVATYLRQLLPRPASASLCAVDGSTTSDLRSQIARVPHDSTHIVVSIGGNDALRNTDLLAMPVTSTGQGLSIFAERILRFERSYKSALDAVLALKRETAICTIYNGNLPPVQAHVARIALMTFNDVILRYAFENGLTVIDLRFICNQITDYANPVEPSGSGGLKIAKAIAGWLGIHEAKGSSRVLIG